MRVESVKATDQERRSELCGRSEETEDREQALFSEKNQSLASQTRSLRAGVLWKDTTVSDIG